MFYGDKIDHMLSNCDLDLWPQNLMSSSLSQSAAELVNLVKFTQAIYNMSFYCWSTEPLLSYGIVNEYRHYSQCYFSCSF